MVIIGFRGLQIQIYSQAGTYGNNLFVIVGFEGTILTSINGNDWTVQN